MRAAFCCLPLLLSVVAGLSAAPIRAAEKQPDEKPSYDLSATIRDGDAASVEITLEVGGDMLVTDDAAKSKKLPLTVKGELRYLEQLVAWSGETEAPARSLRQYEAATASIQVDEAGIVRELPASQRSIVADIRAGRATLAGASNPLTRDEFDLVNVVGNTLALNRLLPGRALAEGEDWKHDEATMQALLGMDHVAVSEVTSVVTGSENGQVQIRLAGTLHGTVDGAPSEMQLRGAYLFHEEYGRITKMNLAIKEVRTANSIVPGLDVVAKVSVSIKPLPATSPVDLISAFDKKSGDTALGHTALSDIAQPIADTLRYESEKSGYRFSHDPLWYVTADESKLVSLRSLQDGNQTAHCNITPLPARSQGRETTLEIFESDVRESLGDKLKTVTASTEWDTPRGNHCLGVVAQGQVDDMAIEWRYYLVAAPGKPRVSLAFTIEQSQLETFQDADRQLVDTLELLETPATARLSRDEQQR